MKGPSGKGKAQEKSAASDAVWQSIGNKPSRTEWKNKNHRWFKKKKVGVGRKPRVKDTRLVAKEVGDEDKS